MSDDEDLRRRRDRRERAPDAVEPAAHIGTSAEGEVRVRQPATRREARAALRAHEQGSSGSTGPAEAEAAGPPRAEPAGPQRAAAAPTLHSASAPATEVRAVTPEPVVVPEATLAGPATRESLLGPLMEPTPVARGANEPGANEPGANEPGANEPGANEPGANTQPGVRRADDGSVIFALTPGELPNARATLPERLAVVLAILVPPLGLVLGVTAAGSSRRQRGWISRVSVLAIALSLVMIAVWIVGGLGVGVAIKAQQRHDAKAAAAKPFCAAIRAAKLDVNDPGFGWPAQQATVDDSLAAMNSFVSAWTAVEKVAPSDISSAVARVVGTGTALEQQAASSRQINIDADLDNWAPIHSASTLPAYVNAYCR